MVHHVFAGHSGAAGRGGGIPTTCDLGHFTQQSVNCQPHYTVRPQLNHAATQYASVITAQPGYGLPCFRVQPKQPHMASRPTLSAQMLPAYAWLSLSYQCNQKQGLCLDHKAGVCCPGQSH